VSPRVSVLIPVFNAQAYLGEALDSIQAQGVADLECIVIDDGSTDPSAEIARDRGARVIPMAHAGVARARNRALAAANGELIAWLDADDRWPEGSLARRIEHLDAHPELDYVYGSMREFSDPDRPPPDWWQPAPADAVGFLSVFVLRREACDRAGPFDASLTIGEDLDWIARLQDAGCRGERIDAVLTEHRIHAGSTMIRNQRLTAVALRTVVWRSLARKRAVRE
jgi:glycosyltransferase involved in cell wall biosynthesis